MMKEMVILVADKNTQFALEELLKRHESLQIKALSKNEYDIFIHPQRDPGVYKDSADFLRPYQSQYHYGLILFDHEGSGQEDKSIPIIEEEMRLRLEKKWMER